MIIGLAVAVLAAFLDQASKMLVFGYLSETAPVVQVTSYFNLVAAWNTGVSFSMFNDLGNAGVYILSAFSLLVAGFLIYWLLNEKERLMQVALGLVIGGAVGNVIDRLRIGAVFDFLDFHISGHHWPAFNLADSFICIGAVLIICNGLLFNCDSKTAISDKGFKK
ncbi:MAG: signal peptidase II [Acetobacter sp.]|nr:signal peptidase II [Acetobacter sp.]